MEHLSAKAIVDVIRINPCTFPGGYEIFGLCMDGYILCRSCILKNKKRCIEKGGDWELVGYQSTMESDSFFECENCNKFISQHGNTMEEYTDTLKSYGMETENE